MSPATPGSSTPWAMLNGLCAPLMRSASRCSSSGSRLRMPSCDSLTMTCSAPASSAPSMAALTSRVMVRRAQPYSAALDPAGFAWSGGRTWMPSTTPVVPSMSAEITIFMTCYPFCEHSPPLPRWAQEIREPIAEEAEPCTDYEDGKPGDRGELPGPQEEVAPLGDHQPPLRVGRLGPQAEERQRGGHQDVEHHVGHREDHDGRDDVGHDVPEDDGPVCQPHDARRLDVLQTLDDQDLAAHDPGVGDPPDEPDGDEDVVLAGAEHGDDRDHQHQEGEGDGDVDDAHDDGVPPLPVEACDRAQDAADDDGDGGGEEGDHQGDPPPGADAGEDVAH